MGSLEYGSSASAASSSDVECHLAGGKEPEIVRELERYQLDMVGLNSMHSPGSGTKLLQRGWTLLFWSCPGCAVSGGCGDTKVPG